MEGVTFQNYRAAAPSLNVLPNLQEVQCVLSPPNSLSNEYHGNYRQQERQYKEREDVIKATFRRESPNATVVFWVTSD